MTQFRHNLMSSGLGLLQRFPEDTGVDCQVISRLYNASISIHNPLHYPPAIAAEAPIPSPRVMVTITVTPDLAGGNIPMLPQASSEYCTSSGDVGPWHE
jgi:hypothetical protein